MRVLVTGATGFIGKHLTKALYKKGHTIRCLVRTTSKKSDLDFLSALDAKLVVGDIADSSSLKQVTSGIDTVFHLAGMLGSFGTPPSKYIRVHVNGTRNLLDQCNGQKFIYMSSAGVLGPVLDADERFPMHPTNAYESSKAQAEQLVQSYRNHVIIRPEFVYGPMDMHVLPLFRSIRDNRFRLIAQGTSYLHPTHVDDVTRVLMKCIGQSNETVLVAGDRPVTVREFASLVAQAMNQDCRPSNIPLAAARAAALILESGARITGLHPVLTQSRVDFFTQSRTFSTATARRLLAYSPIPLEKGLQRTIVWYTNNGLL